MIREFPLLNLNFRRFSETASSQQTSKNNQGQDAGGVIGMIPVQEPIHLWLRGSGRLSSHWWSENQQYTAILLYWCVYCVYIHIYILLLLLLLLVLLLLFIYVYCIYIEREKDCYFVIIDWFPESHMTHFPWIVMIQHLGLWVPTCFHRGFDIPHDETYPAMIVWKKP